MKTLLGSWWFILILCALACAAQLVLRYATQFVERGAK